MKQQETAIQTITPMELIQRRIFFIRRHRVMLSTHLAELYEVEPKVLVQAVKRNIARFPHDFMFQLSRQEFDGILKSQIVTSKADARGGIRRATPYAFTEQGVAMLSSVLRSECAVQVNIAIMRAFVQLREILASHRELARKLDEMERRYDARFRVVFDAIRELMQPPEEPDSGRKIGFRAEEACYPSVDGESGDK